MKTKLALLLAALAFGLCACSTASVTSTNATVAPIIQPAIQAVATFAISKDASLKPDLQTALSALQDLQLASVVATPATVTAALDKAFSLAGSTPAHVTYLNSLLAPYLADIATDLPAVVTGLNAALAATAPPAPAPSVSVGIITPSPAPAAASGTN